MNNQQRQGQKFPLKAFSCFVRRSCGLEGTTLVENLGANDTFSREQSLTACPNLS